MLIQITLLPAFVLALATSVISSSSTEKPTERSAIGISARPQKPLARCPTISTDGQPISLPGRPNDSKPIKFSYISHQNTQEHHGIRTKPSSKLASLPSNFQIKMIDKKSELLKLLWEVNGENMASDRRGIHQESLHLSRKPQPVTTHLLGVPVIIRGFSSKKLKLALA